MKKALANILAHLFGLLVLIAVLIGALDACMLFVGFVIGGSGAAHLALWGKKLLDYAIKIAALGVLFGLLNFYIGGQHELTLKNDNLDSPEFPEAEKAR